MNRFDRPMLALLAVVPALDFPVASVGAGLFGMLFGHGFMGGMGGCASMLGLLLQIGLVLIVARLAWVWWQRRNQPATAGGPSLRDNLSNDRPNAGGFSGFGGGASAP